MFISAVMAEACSGGHSATSSFEVISGVWELESDGFKNVFLNLKYPCRR